MKKKQASRSKGDIDSAVEITCLGVSKGEYGLERVSKGFCDEEENRYFFKSHTTPC